MLIPDLGNSSATIYSNTDSLPVAAPSEGYTPGDGAGGSEQRCGQGVSVSTFKQNFQSSECITNSENKNE